MKKYIVLAVLIIAAVVAVVIVNNLPPTKVKKSTLSDQATKDYIQAQHEYAAANPDNAECINNLIDEQFKNNIVEFNTGFLIVGFNDNQTFNSAAAYLAKLGLGVSLDDYQKQIVDPTAWATSRKELYVEVKNNKELLLKCQLSNDPTIKSVNFYQVVLI